MGPPPYARSRGPCRGVLGPGAVRLLKCRPGGGLSRTTAGHAEGEPEDLLHSHPNQPGCRKLFRHDAAEIGAGLLRSTAPLKGIADFLARAPVAPRDGN